MREVVDDSEDEEEAGDREVIQIVVQEDEEGEPVFRPAEEEDELDELEEMEDLEVEECLYDGNIVHEGEMKELEDEVVERNDIPEQEESLEEEEKRLGETGLQRDEIVQIEEALVPEDEERMVIMEADEGPTEEREGLEGLTVHDVKLTQDIEVMQEEVMEKQ